ncbi:MAG: phage tail tube protein [bacterium]
MPILAEKAQVAARIESTEGVAENLGAADALLVLQPWFEPKVEVHPREVVRASFSSLEGVSGKRSAEIGFSVELKGSGARGQAPAWGALMKACGFAEDIVTDTSVTYTPASGSIPSATLSYYLDGVIGTLWGARGEVSLALSAGQPGLLNFRFLGADFSVTDGNMLTGVSYESNLPPVFVSAGLVLGSYSAQIETMRIELNNKLNLKTDINQASGHKTALISGRKPTGEFDPEMAYISDHDFFGRWRSGSLMSLQTSWGTGSGNIVTLAAPACRYLGFNLDDRNGIAVLKGEFELTGPAGDDELTVTLT